MPETAVATVAILNVPSLIPNMVFQWQIQVPLLRKSRGMVLQVWTRLLRHRSFSLIVSKLKTFFLYILSTSFWNFCNCDASEYKYIKFYAN